MKLIAVLVVVAVLNLPLFLRVAYIIIQAARGKDVATVWQTARSVRRRTLYLLLSAHSLAMATATSWASYVFVKSWVYSTMIGGGYLLFLAFAILIIVFGRRWGLKPPPGVLQDKRALLEWENKRADSYPKVFLKIFLLVLILAAVIVAIEIALLSLGYIR